MKWLPSVPSVPPTGISFNAVQFTLFLLPNWRLSSLFSSMTEIDGILFFQYWTFFFVLQINLAPWHIQLPHWNWKIKFLFLFQLIIFLSESFSWQKYSRKRRVKKHLFLINLWGFCQSILLLNVAEVRDKVPITNYLHVILWFKWMKNIKAEKM